MRYYLVDVKLVEINVTHIAEMHNMCVSTCDEGSNFVEFNFRVRVSWKFSRLVQRNIRQVTWLCHSTKIAVPLHSSSVKCNRVTGTRRGKFVELRNSTWENSRVTVTRFQWTRFDLPEIENFSTSMNFPLCHWTVIDLNKSIKLRANSKSTKFETHMWWRLRFAVVNMLWYYGCCIAVHMSLKVYEYCTMLRRLF